MQLIVLRNPIKNHTYVFKFIADGGGISGIFHAMEYRGYFEEPLFYFIKDIGEFSVEVDASEEEFIEKLGFINKGSLLNLLREGIESLVGMRSLQSSHVKVESPSFRIVKKEE